MVGETKIIGLAAAVAGALAFQVQLVNATEMSQFAVGAQYSTTHVYVAADDMDRFTASFLATFGGKSTPQSVVTVTADAEFRQLESHFDASGHNFAVRIQDGRFPIRSVRSEPAIW